MRILFTIGLLISFWLVPSSVKSQQSSVQTRALEIAAAFNKQKDKLKEKSGGNQERYYRKVGGKPRIRQSISAYSGTYEMPGLNFTINLQVGNDGQVEATGFESSTGSAARKARLFKFENAKIEGSLLTGTKVYEDGRSEKFEGVFMNRTVFSSPTDKGVTVFGLGVVGVSVEFAGIVFNKLFYEKLDENEEDLFRLVDGKRVEPGKSYALNAPPHNPPTDNLISQKDLEIFLDPIFAERMGKLHIPGAVVSIVKDGKIIFAKGYGVADVEKKTPVVADKTLFRIGSITKVFTAMAVMQMADEGKIKLTDDVNKYLKGVSVPNTFAQPVTFDNLLTHTSGLDEISPGRRTSNEAEVVPLGAFLKSRIVRQFAPGEIISYSTYNPALAAHAVEQITQQPFKVYLQKKVFEPLGMNRTSITAVKEEYKNDLATGYEYADNKYEKLPFQWFNTYPASDVNSTATDMARFMIANLNYGAIDGKRILSERAAREMQATHFRNHPKIPGWAYGFYETEQNNLRFVEHGGSMDDGYSALLSMIPEKNTGLFVACNTESCAFGLAGAIKNAFLNRYFPAPKKTKIPQTKSPAPDALKKFAGKYKSIIYCHSCAPNTSYVPEPDEVKITDDGMLIFGGGRWKQIEPLLFVLADGERAGQVLLGFKENAKGEIAFMFNDTYRVYEKVFEVNK